MDGQSTVGGWPRAATENLARLNLLSHVTGLDRGIGQADPSRNAVEAGTKESQEGDLGETLSRCQVLKGPRGLVPSAGRLSGRVLTPEPSVDSCPPDQTVKNDRQEDEGEDLRDGQRRCLVSEGPQRLATPVNILPEGLTTPESSVGRIIIQVTKAYQT